MALGKLTKIVLSPTPALLAELEEFAFFAQRPEAGDPALASYYDRRGKLRRITAAYSDGWRAQINIDANGYVTSSRASLRLIAKGEAANA